MTLATFSGSVSAKLRGRNREANSSRGTSDTLGPDTLAKNIW